MATSLTYTLGAPVLVSGASPFGGCPTGSAGSDSVNYPNTEVEPFVAVNPTNGKIIGVFQQDRWNDGGAKANGAAGQRTVRAGCVTLRSSARVRAVPQSTSAPPTRG